MRAWIRAAVLALSAAGGGGAAPGGDLRAIPITPETGDASTVFEALRERGFRVAILGRHRFERLCVPALLHERTVPLSELVDRVAAHNRLRAAWCDGGRAAVLYPGADDAEIESLLSGLRSPDAGARSRAAWRAGWIEDARVMPLLAAAAGDPDARTARCALRSLRRLGWEASSLLGGDTLKDLARRDPESHLDWRPPDPAAAWRGPDGNVDRAAAERALESPDRSVRAAAFEALGRLGDPRSIPAVEKAMGYPQQETRGFAIMTLVRLGDPRAVPWIRTTFADLGWTDPHPPWASALGELEGVRGEEAARFIEPLLEWRSGPVALAAVKAAGRLPEDEALPLLAKGIEGGDSDVQDKAAAALAGFRSERAFELLETALRDPRWERTSSTWWILAALRGPRAVPLLERILRRGRPGTAGDAAAALARFGGTEGLHVLERAQREGGPDVRSAVVGAMRAGAPVAGWRRTVLERGMDDPDEQVRDAAIRALGRLDGEWGIDRLARALESPEIQARMDSAHSMGGVGGPEALGLLRRLARDGDPRTRASAMRALGELGGEAALDIARQGVDDPDEAVAWPARIALGKLGGGDPAVLRRLLQDLADPRPAVRRGAAHALGETAGDEACAALEKAARDPDESVRDAAFRALAAIGSEDAREALKRLLRAPGAPASLQELRLRSYPRSDLRFLFSLSPRGSERVALEAEALLRDRDAGLRTRAAQRYLFDLPESEGVVAALAQIATEGSIPALDALGRAGNEGNLDLLERLAEDPGRDANVREAALRAIWGIGGPRAIRLAIRLAEDPKGQPRVDAVRALGRLGGADARAALTDLRGDPDERVRGYAAEGLVFGFPGTPAPVEPCLRDPSRLVRQQTAAALARLRSAESVALLDRALQDRDPAVRLDILRGLEGAGEAWNGRIVRELPSLLSAPDAATRMEAVPLAARIPAGRGLLLGRLRSEPQADVRRGIALHLHAHFPDDPAVREALKAPRSP